MQSLVQASLARRILSLLVFGLAGCSSAPSTTPPAAPSTTATSCSGGQTYHADAYTPNMDKAGDAKAFTFVLVSADPVPPGVNSNTWTLKLLDASGKPVTDATFPTIKTWMPLHGHSSSVLPTAMSNGDGTYKVSLYLFMPGLWQITFNALAGSVSDSAMFTFCVE
ncbi:MAG TPA: FixH family protein [Polyangiaceae bacterium]|nr:FixH family protein [Polyangiaceae bacterium]